MQVCGKDIQVQRGLTRRLCQRLEGSGAIIEYWRLGSEQAVRQMLKDNIAKRICDA